MHFKPCEALIWRAPKFALSFLYPSLDILKTVLMRKIFLTPKMSYVLFGVNHILQLLKTRWPICVIFKFGSPIVQYPLLF